MSFPADHGFAVEDTTGGIYVALTDAASASFGQSVRVTGRVSGVAKLIALSTHPELVTPASPGNVLSAARALSISPRWPLALARTRRVVCRSS